MTPPHPLNIVTNVGKVVFAGMCCSVGTTPMTLATCAPEETLSNKSMLTKFN